jgi:hydrogenase nickel incorporation protein HypA/HybF
MHEISIVQSMLDMALEKAQASKATRIHRLRVRIGAMAGVVPEALEFAFEALREGTPAAHARLEIENVPVSYWCERCNAEFTPKDLLSDCPRCGQASGQMRAGLELDLVSIEVS